LRGSKNKQNKTKKNRKILPLSLRTYLVRKKEEGEGRGGWGQESKEMQEGK
jgi:hypothetical protein